jgi:hypothetical protein
VTKFNCALSDKEGTTKYYIRDPKDGGGNGISGFPKDEGVPTIDVPTKTLDSFGLTNINFIKIDVEGHELQVLQGMNIFLKINKPIFLIEIEKRYNASFEKVFMFLKKRNYKSYILKENKNLININRNDFKKIINKRSYNNFFFISNY